MLLPHDDVGAGPAVVLLHAGVADRRMWADLLPSIAAAGYRAIAVDLPGFGDAADPAYAPHAAVLDTMDALGVERAALIGNSFGGAVALRVAVVAPDRVTAMALVSALAPGVEPSAELEAAWEAEESALERGDIEGAVAAVIDAWTLPDAPSSLRALIAEMQRRAFELQARAGEEMPDDDPLEPDPSALLTLSMPALVAVGELDIRDFHVGAEVLAQQLRQARRTTIPRAGHLAPLEQPQVFRRLVLDHLRETRPAGQGTRSGSAVSSALPSLGPRDTAKRSPSAGARLGRPGRIGLPLRRGVRPPAASQQGDPPCPKQSSSTPSARPSGAPTRGR